MKTDSSFIEINEENKKLKEQTNYTQLIAPSPPLPDIYETVITVQITKQILSLLTAIVNKYFNELQTNTGNFVNMTIIIEERYNEIYKIYNSTAETVNLVQDIVDKIITYSKITFYSIDYTRFFFSILLIITFFLFIILGLLFIIFIKKKIILNM
jgi:hypothetical protein